MTDASSTYGDGAIPADADFAPDIADDDEVASLAETGDGGVVNPPLPDYAEPQKGSDADKTEE